MKKADVAMTCTVVLAIALEALPFGAVLNFANPDGESLRRTFSYFDLTPFGYANFGPFLTALLSCILLVLSVLYWFLQSHHIKSAYTVVSLVAVLTSLSPLLYGVRYFTWIGLAISCLLLMTCVLSFLKRS